MMRATRKEAIPQLEWLNVWVSSLDGGLSILFFMKKPTAAPNKKFITKITNTVMMAGIVFCQLNPCEYINRIGTKTMCTAPRIPASAPLLTVFAGGVFSSVIQIQAVMIPINQALHCIVNAVV